LLTLIFAESALETIPTQLWEHPVVRNYAKLRHKPPRFIILDRSYHHSAMKMLPHSEKRGRPDIVHFALLGALGSPLNKEKLLTAYVHTINDKVIYVDSETRLPRNCNRFISLMEQGFEFGRIPPKQTEKPLLVLKQQTLTQLMREIQPSYTLALTRKGKPKTLEKVISKIAGEKKPAVFVGGFPKGHFSEATLKLADDIVCIDREMLETWTVASRVIYEFEHALSLPKKRLKY
jgi:rRNA small subunit pseudouridine methyltransferase Nep1